MQAEEQYGQGGFQCMFYTFSTYLVARFQVDADDFYITFADVGNGHYQPLYNAPSQGAPAQAPVNYGATN
jgi:hypothetical protein